MEQQQSSPLTTGLPGSIPTEPAIDGATAVETDIRVAPASLANPKRLRLGASPSL
ncbi:hypothetical protein MXD61_18760 [Frankia sp. AgPm24]|uniref:hypothetical protein n=1 Tax=Frankia sp. AgPm24 TaxID=631128 RepID=UPI00200C8B2A|nr:hypothetical protein [Frankia sp. AgPm24]MCK9923884.1 hypothetical protein [Frankia sp. AgPm24]